MMKVIGKTKEGYICEISHSELEKVLDKYYGHLKPLDVGSDIDLSQGYSFRNDINATCKKMIAATESFEQAQKTMIKFAKMIIDIKTGELE